MKLNDFINKIINEKEVFYVIVGPNASGKTHALNNVYKESDSKVLFCDEDGLYKTKLHKKVKSYDRHYYYVDDELRGKGNIESEHEEMSDDSFNITKEINELKNGLPTKHISLGIKKINNIIEAILSYNLNNISLFLFDEPENALDDSRIKILHEIFKILNKYGKKIVIVTHSPRLLEIMQIDICNIYVFPKIFSEIININYSLVDQYYKECGAAIKNISVKQQDRQIDQLVYNSPKEMRDIYLHQLLSSQDFYRSLFYNEVWIAEGLTEKWLMTLIDKKDIKSANVFFSNGKFTIPFLANLFINLGKRVCVLIDKDTDKQGNLPFEINKYIETIIENENKIVYLDPNLEGYLNIENMLIEKINNKPSNGYKGIFEKKFKPYIAYYELENDKAKLKKFEDLFENHKIWLK